MENSHCFTFDEIFSVASLIKTRSRTNTGSTNDPQSVARSRNTLFKTSGDKASAKKENL